MSSHWELYLCFSPLPPTPMLYFPQGRDVYGYISIFSVQPRVWYLITNSEMLHIWVNLWKTRCPQGSSLREARNFHPKTKKIKRWHFHSKHRWIFLFALRRDNAPQKSSSTEGGWDFENSSPYHELFFFSFHTFFSTFSVLTSLAAKFCACLTKPRDSIFF